MRTKIMVLVLTGIGLTTALMGDGFWDDCDDSHAKWKHHQKYSHHEYRHRKWEHHKKYGRKDCMHERGEYYQRGYAHDDGYGYTKRQYRDTGRWDKKKRGERYPGDLIWKIGRMLDLTQEQREKIREILMQERQKKQAVPVKDRQAKKYGGDMFKPIKPEAFMTRDRFDKTAYIKAVQEQAAERMARRQARLEQQVNQRADLMEKVFAILTPEQRMKWVQMSRDREQKQ